MSIWSSIGSFLTDNVLKTLNPISQVTGAISGIGNAISGVSNLLGLSDGGKAEAQAYQKELLEYQAKVQQEENQKNRDFQAIQTDKMNEFNALQADIARQFEADEWTRRSDYNSPAELAKRLEAANLSRHVLAGQSPATAVGGINGSAASAAGVPSGNSGISLAGADAGIINSGYVNAQRQIDSANQMFDLLSKASKLAYVAPREQAEINQIVEDTRNAIRQGEWQDIENNLRKMFGEKEYNAKIDNLVAHTKQLEQDVKLKIKQGYLADAQQDVANHMQFYYDALGNLAEWQKNVLSNTLGLQLEMLRAQIKTEQSKQNVNNSQAALNVSQKQTIDQVRPHLVELQQALASRNKADAHAAWASMKTRLERENLITKKTAAELEQAIVRADWATANQILSTIHSVLGLGMDVKNLGAPPGMMNPTQFPNIDTGGGSFTPTPTSPYGAPTLLP